MVHIDELTAYLHEYLRVDLGADYAPNGLQVEGRTEIQHVVAGVSASAALLEQAVELEADAVLVHHGILWDAARPRVVGSFRRRLRLLLENDLNLLAYHLPLDRHPEVGTAAVLARALGWRALEPFGDHRGQPLGVCAVVDAMPVDEVVARVRAVLGREPLVFAGGPPLVRSAAVVTGGGFSEFQRAVEMRLDLFLTGEPKEPTMDLAREEGLHVIAGGHYHTEAPGVRALADHLESRFDLDVTFVDLPNPV